MKKKQHPGMGAVLHADGTAFRVWAPHAQQVFVKGDFNDWDDTAHPLEQEGNGYWYADVAGAHPGQGYKYRIVRLYRDLITLRLNRSGETRGLCGQFINLNLFHVNDQDNVLAFPRWDRHGPGDDVVVVLNFGHQARESYEIGMPVEGHWRLRFNSDASSYSGDFGNHPSADVVAHAEPMDGLAARASVSIGPYSALIYCLPAASANAQQ